MPPKDLTLSKPPSAVSIVIAEISTRSTRANRIFCLSRRSNLWVSCSLR